MQQSLKQLVQELENENEELERPEWQPGLDRADRVPSVVAKVVEEIGSNTLLAEAALHWIRTKKQEMVQGQLVTLYGPEHLERLKQKLEQKESSP